MASVSDAFAHYLSSQRSYQRAVDLAGSGTAAPFSGAALRATGSAATAARHALLSARLASGLREELRPEVLDNLLSVAIQAAQSAAEAAEEAAHLTEQLCRFDPLATGGERMKERAARIEAAIKDALKDETCCSESAEERP